MAEQQQQQEQERRTGVMGVVDNVRDRFRGFAETVGVYNWGGSSEERTPLIDGRGAGSPTSISREAERDDTSVGRGEREGSV